MKVLVAVKRVLDYNVRVRVNAEKTGVDIHGSKMSINPFCENAIEESIRLKEKKLVSEIIAVTCGKKEDEAVLRSALALGADKAIHVVEQEALLPLDVARTLASIVRQQQPNLVLLGKQAIDDDCNQTGQMLAGILGWGQCTFASKVEITEDQKQIQVEREVDSGLQTLRTNLPAVVTADLRLNTPRYPALTKVLKAKKITIQQTSLQELGVHRIQGVNMVHVDYPPERKKGQMLSTVDQLIDKLRNEAKVIQF